MLYVHGRLERTRPEVNEAIVTIYASPPFQNVTANELMREKFGRGSSVGAPSHTKEDIETTTSPSLKTYSLISVWLLYFTILYLRSPPSLLPTQNLFSQPS